MKAAPSRLATFKLRLYVAGDAQNSVQAVANLSAFCRTYLADRHEMEVINVFQAPERALADGIFMTPALIKLAPLPIRRVVGTLSQTQPLLHALGLES